jgi:hypothetical protein
VNHPKSPQRITAAAGLAALALLATCMGTAHAAPEQKPQVKHHLKVTYSTPHTTKAAAPGKLCSSPVVVTQEFIRTHACKTVQATVTVLKIVNGVPHPEGTARFTIEHEIDLKLRGTKWSEKIAVSKARVTGRAGGIRTVFRPTAPGATAKATGTLAKPFTLGSSAPSGGIDLRMPVAKMKKRTTATKYVFAMTKPGYLPGRMSYASERYRCDDTLWNDSKTRRTAAAGCVFPKHAATDDGTLPSGMAFLPGIASNIRKVQAAPLHIGRPGSSVPLTRAGEATKKKNRQAVCGGRKPGRGDVTWVVVPSAPGQAYNPTSPSCDEYPFASTHQGGTAYAPPNRAIKWVPRWENTRQGQILNSFYTKYRVLVGDPYYVNMG